MHNADCQLGRIKVYISISECQKLSHILKKPARISLTSENECLSVQEEHEKVINYNFNVVESFFPPFVL